MHRMSESGSSAHSVRFRSTHWSLISQAGGEAGDDQRRAFSELCEGYWSPVYAFLRRRGMKPEEAEDLTQDFFAELMDSGRLLQTADPEKGRFRTYLLAALKNRLANHRRGEATARRGGNVVLCSVDWSEAEKGYSAEPCHQLTPEAIFHRRWALAVLQCVLDRLTEKHRADGRERWFSQLRGFLTTDESPPYAELASQLHTTESAVRVAVCRLRRQYRDALIAEIRDTLGEDEDVDLEQAELFRALGGNFFPESV